MMKNLREKLCNVCTEYKSHIYEVEMSFTQRVEILDFLEWTLICQGQSSDDAPDRVGKNK
jgi:hypothetical protein